MTTLVLTGYNDAFAPLGDLTSPRLLAYVGRNGYDFECFRHPGSGIETSWHKIHETLKGLLHYDRVLWVDADMLITNDAITHDYESGFHASMDWGKDATEPRHFSSGAYLVCRDASDLFAEVIGLEESLIAKGQWEQDALRKQSEHYPHVVTIHPRRTFNAVHPSVHADVVDPWQPGDWAAHFTMIPLAERVRLCKEMLP